MKAWSGHARVLVAAPLLAAGAPPGLAHQTTPGNESEGSLSPQRIVLEAMSCLAKYAAESERGFPESLDQVGPAGDGCLPGLEAGRLSRGYFFAYSPGLPSPDGRIASYALCALPIDPGAAGGEALVGNATGALAAVPVSRLSVADVSACSEVWQARGRRLQAIESCAIEYAAAHPSAGYPGSLVELGPEGSGCLSASDRSGRIDPSWLTTPDGRFTYTPGPPDPTGRRTSFGVTARSRNGRSNYRLDENGVVRANREYRPATECDPTLAQLLDMEHAAREGERLTRGCDAGRASSCFKLGKLYARGDGFDRDPERAHALYVTACDRGSREACFELRRTGGHEVTREGAAWLEKGCRLGHAESCTYLAHEIEESQLPPARRVDPSRISVSPERAAEAARRRPAPTPTPEPTPEPVRLEGDRQYVIDLLTRACEADDGCVTLSSRACSRLGAAYLGGKGVPADVRRALGYFDRACQGGFPTACHALALILSDGELTPREPERALALREVACEQGTGCVELAGLYERGEGAAPRDPGRALALYRWACDDHDPNGCDAVERLTGSRP